MGAQELDVANLDGMLAANFAGDARYGIGKTAAAEDRAGVFEIDALQRGGEAVGVAFAANLAIRDDVQAGAFLIADGEQSGVILRLFEPLGRDAPQLLFADARRGVV